MVEECYPSRPSVAFRSETLSNATESIEISPHLSDGQEYLKQQLDGKPAACYKKYLHSNEVVEKTLPLSTRTDALLNTKSFNLVKPKDQ